MLPPGGNAIRNYIKNYVKRNTLAYLADASVIEKKKFSPDCQVLKTMSATPVFISVAFLSQVGIFMSFCQQGILST